ncbi:MAG: hypothetical protein N0C86_17965 [Candidatus Thiodiazotropha taylori]|nr:hypothetical protein [Candidatus Thiodiazotropha taylori]MCW4327884.1 hypothetical protein [Candidatus Thiodiazotropha taylori]
MDELLKAQLQLLKKQSRKSVIHAKEYCELIANCLESQEVLPSFLQEDLVQIFKSGSKGSIDTYIGLKRKRGQKAIVDPAILHERNMLIWEKVSELHQNNPNLFACCAQLEEELHLGPRQIEQIYNDMQTAFEEMGRE